MSHPAAPDTLSPQQRFDQAWQLRHSDPAQARQMAQALLNDPAVAPHAQVLLSMLHFQEGRHTDALQAALAASPDLRERADLSWLARSLNVAALAADTLGQRDLALTYHQERLGIARQLQNLVMEGVTLLNMGVVWFITDRTRAAEYFRAAVEVLEQAAPEGQGNLAHAYVNLGILDYEAGQHDQGTLLMERGRNLSRSTGDLDTWVSAVSHLAQVYTERGDPKKARQELRGALTSFPKLPEGLRRQLLYALVVVEHHAGEPQAALDAYEHLRHFTLTALEQQAIFPVRIDAHAKLGQFQQAYLLSQELLTFNETLYKKERETELLQLEERHQAETARRDAELRRLEAQAARRDAQLKHLENVELQRALEAHAGLIQSLRESQLVSETLLGVSHLTQLDLDPLDLARHAVALVMRLVDADWCLLARIHSGEVTLEPVWTADGQNDAFARLTLPGLLGVRDPLLHRSARHDDPTFVSAYPTTPAAHPALVAAGLQGFASLPAGTAHDLTYVLLLGRMGEDRRWSERDRQVLSATGRALRVAVEEQERSRRTREAALTDALTGLGNRRAFEAHLREAQGRPTFSVAMLDLDGLKRVNDTRGHAAGDTLLQVFAANLRASAPDQMQVFRLGGDEIALLIEHRRGETPGTVQAEVLEVLDAGVAAVRTAGFPEAGCSFGVARWPDEAPTAAEVVALADTRLYADKQARKTRRTGQDVVSFGDTTLEVRSRDVHGPLGQVKLSPREAEILQALASRGQQVVPRVALTGPGGDAGSGLDAQVSTLRRKLAAVTQHAGIRTVRGQGFSLHWYHQGDQA